MKKNSDQFIAGSSAIDITPGTSLYLAGYPFVERYSTGVHDPLLSSALYLSDGATGVVFISNDVIFVSKSSVARVRKTIFEKTGIPQGNILISASHTHSGPSTVTFTAGTQDPLLPPVPGDFVQFMEDKMIEAACLAIADAQPAEAGLGTADATGIGTNRHDPGGPSDLEVPVLLVRNMENKHYIACLLVCCMHPTVLHEDSTLISGDFPGIARQIIQKEIMGTTFPVLYHTGPSGNQSPRHVTRENTFREAQRIAGILAHAVAGAIDQIKFHTDITLSCSKLLVELPKKTFPQVAEAEAQLQKVTSTLEELKKAGSDKGSLRTAEVNWFGAIESLHLSKLWNSNSLQQVYNSCLPAEIQLIRIGPWYFIGWPGEIFVEYGIEVKNRWKNAFIITLANGELQGYIVTKEAAEGGGYEASNAIFDPSAGDTLVKETFHLLNHTS